MKSVVDSDVDSGLRDDLSLLRAAGVSDVGLAIYLDSLGFSDFVGCGRDLLGDDDVEVSG